MNIKRYEDAQSFLTDVQSFLMKEEQLNNLMLGLLHRLQSQPHQPEHVFLRLTSNEDQLVMMIAGLYLIIYANTEAESIYQYAIDYLDSKHIDYPGIIGPLSYCKAFKQVYDKRNTNPLVIGMQQRIYVAQHVESIDTIDGIMVLAKSSDRPILYPWMKDFYEAINEPKTDEMIASIVDRLLDSNTLYLLMHQDQIVSMAAGIRPFLKGISVGYVYTPKALRNHGYATTCVYKLTEMLLKTYDYCTLYTDLSNPTSNSIYQKIGYRPIGDSVVYLKSDQR